MQPLFGFGDRKLSANDEVTKKPKSPTFPNAQIAAARCYMKHASAIAPLKPDLKKFGFPKTNLKKSFLVTVSVFYFFEKNPNFFFS